jgi:hypothetical protein
MPERMLLESLTDDTRVNELLYFNSPRICILPGQGEAWAVLFSGDTISVLQDEKIWRWMWLVIVAHYMNMLTATELYP